MYLLPSNPSTPTQTPTPNSNTRSNRILAWGFPKNRGMSCAMSPLTPYLPSPTLTPNTNPQNFTSQPLQLWKWNLPKGLSRNRGVLYAMSLLPSNSPTQTPTSVPNSNTAKLNYPTVSPIILNLGMGVFQEIMSVLSHVPLNPLPPIPIPNLNTNPQNFTNNH